MEYLTTSPERVPAEMVVDVLDLITWAASYELLTVEPELDESGDLVCLFIRCARDDGSYWVHTWYQYKPDDSDDESEILDGYYSGPGGGFVGPGSGQRFGKWLKVTQSGGLDI